MVLSGTVATPRRPLGGREAGSNFLSPAATQGAIASVVTDCLT